MKSLKECLEVAFPISSVWFGALVGPSMVSGVFAIVYFSPYGMWGILLPFVSMGVACFIVGFGLLGIKEWKIDNYSDYGKRLYGKYSKYLSPLLEIYLILAMLVGGSSVIAMGGIFFHDLISVPEFVGQILMAIISSVLVLWGAELVRRSSVFMTIVLLVGFSLLIVLSCYSSYDNLVEKIMTWYVPEGITFWQGVTPAIALGLSNACNALTLSSVGQRLRTNSDVILTILISFIINSMMFVGCVIFLLPYIPAVLTKEVPNLFVLQQYLTKSYSWLPMVYNIVMLFGLASSGVPQLNAVAYRVINFYPNTGIFKKNVCRNICTSILYMIICIMIATCGLQTIISKGYSILGYLAIPLIVIPICIFMPIRLYRENARHR